MRLMNEMNDYESSALKLVTQCCYLEYINYL